MAGSGERPLPNRGTAPRTSRTTRRADDPDYGTLWSVGGVPGLRPDGRLTVRPELCRDPRTEPICSRPEAPDYCHLSGYKGLPNSLHNNADGTFTDVSGRASGPRREGWAWHRRFRQDGWPDALVSNDNWPAFLFRNQKGERFEEIGSGRGAYTERGKEIFGMGADARDVDNDGRVDLFRSR